MTGSLSSQSAVRSLTLDDVRVTYAVDGAMWLARTAFFPNARYVLAEQEWAPHGRGETIPGAPGRSVVDLFAADHVAVGDGEEVFPGVHTLITPGHSPGHTSYVISTPTARVIAFGDVFHVPAQISHPEWPSAPDVDAGAVVVARRRLVEELERPGTVGFSCHFGDQPFGRVVRDDDGTPRWEPVDSTVVLPAPRA